MNRCAIGDLAFVIQEIEGCEGNIGKIVQVVGHVHDSLSHITRFGHLWEIKPIKQVGWWERKWSWRSRRLLKAKYNLNVADTYIPDAWLLPIRDQVLLQKVNAIKSLAEPNEREQAYRVLA
jgi:hypothetical protein